MEDVAADRHEPHNFNPNRPALTRQQDISVRQKKMNSMTPIHNPVAFLISAVVLLGCGMPRATADPKVEGWERIANKQRQVKNTFRDQIKNMYPRLSSLGSSEHGYPVGVTKLVMEAVQMGIFYEGQPLDDVADVFDRREWMHARINGRIWILIPLEYLNVPSKIPQTVGVQWHLALRLDDKSVIEGVGMEYCSGKTLLARGATFEKFSGSPATKKVEQVVDGKPPEAPQPPR